MYLDRTYSELVRKCVESGLQRLVRRGQVWQHGGSPLVNGAFAVVKDLAEDRFISALVQTNSLLNAEALPRPVFAYTPRLRGTLTRRGMRIRICKRDARHYFHRLRIHKRWHKYLAHPPVNGELYPVHRCAPMGFAPSAGWAQAVTDRATSLAGLPADRRNKFTTEVPHCLPLWGFYRR